MIKVFSSTSFEEDDSTINDKMVTLGDKLRLKGLLIDTIRLLCKSGLSIEADFRIEATIGITLSESDVLLFSFNEQVAYDRSATSQIAAGNGIAEGMDNGDRSDGAHTGMCMRYPQNLRPTSNDYKTGSKMHSSSLPDRSHRGIHHRQSKMSTDIADASGIRTGLSFSRPAVESADYFDVHLKMLGFSPGNYDSQSVYRDGSSTDQMLMVKTETELVDDDVQTFPSTEEHEVPTASCSWAPDHTSATETDEMWKNSSHKRAFPFIKMSKQRRSHTDTTKPVVYGRNGGRRSIRFGSSDLQMTKMNADGSGSQGTTRNRKSSSNLGGGASMAAGSNGAMTREQHLQNLNCDQCGALLGSLQTLRAHVRKKHMGLMVERCCLCGERFRWASQVKRHKRLFHPNIDVAAGFL